MPIQSEKGRYQARSVAESSSSVGLDPWLVGILVAGLLIRAALLTNPGYETDVAFWKSYLTYSTAFGIQNVYGLDVAPLQPYPPVLLYLLWGLGSIYTGLWPEARDSTLLTAFVKLPAAAADLVVALLVAAYIRRWSAPGALSPRVAAGIIALHPALIWLSAYWGQVDILTAAIGAGAWGAACAGFPTAAGALLAVGVLTKPQGLIIVPAAVLLLSARSGFGGVLRATGAGVIVAVLATLPFLLAGYAREVAGIYVGAAGVYPFVSAYAFNPWWIVALSLGGGRETPLIRDDIALIGPLTPHLLGLVLFVVATGWVCVRSYQAGRGADLSGSRAWRLLTLQWLAFFLLPTQVHERYLAPALISMAPAVLLEPRWKWTYLILSLGVLLNVMYVLPGSGGLLAVARVLSGEGVLVAAGLSWVVVTLVRAELREGSGGAPP